MSRRTPAEVDAFLRAYVEGHTAAECSAEVMKRFNYDMSPAQVKQFKTYRKIKSNTRGGCFKSIVFSDEIRGYIQENYNGVGPTEMAERINSKYGTSYTAAQLKSYYNNHKLNSGLTGHYEKGNIPFNKGKKMPYNENSSRTQFKKGLTPHNKMKIGSVVVKADGYLWQKTGEGKRDWRQLHFIVWEEHNGPIPAGGVITFLDGDHMNCNIENLMLIDNRLNAQLTGYKLRSENADLTKAAALMLKLDNAVKDIKKQGGKHDS